MNSNDLKDNCKLFYMVKGHLNVSIDTINKSAPGYFIRLWNNNEAQYREHGFEKHFQKFLNDNINNLSSQLVNHFLNKTTNKKKK